MRKYFRRLMHYLLLVLLLIILIAGISDWYIGTRFNQFIYSDINQIPQRKIALVLGTAKYVNNGGSLRSNAYYAYRMSAAAKLFLAGKVNGILVSGDNSTEYYDEPSSMTQDLIALGVPAQYITQDYAGFRTLDSIVRAHKIFGLEDDYTIVSQRFHDQRALYLANCNGQKPIAFSASDIQSVQGLKIRLREVFARVKAVLDCQFFHTAPKFLGPKERLNYRKY